MNSIDEGMRGHSIARKKARSRMIDYIFFFIASPTPKHKHKHSRPQIHIFLFCSIDSSPHSLWISVAQRSTHIQRVLVCVNKNRRHTGNHFGELLLLSLWYRIMFFKWEGHALAHFSGFATATQYETNRKREKKIQIKIEIMIANTKGKPTNETMTQNKI